MEKFRHLTHGSFDKSGEFEKSRQPFVKIEQAIDQWYGLHHALLFSFNPRI